MACELTLLEAVDAPWPCGRTGDVAWMDHDLLDGAPRHEGLCAVFSGSLGDTRFDPDVRSWLPGARETLASHLDTCPLNVLLRPHHAHMLNDVPGTRSLLQERGVRPVALDVAALFTPSMVVDAAAHLDRIILGLGPMAGAVLLTDVRIDDVDGCCACQIGEGMLPGRVVGDTIKQWRKQDSGADVVIGVFASDVDSAARWLGWL